MPVSLSFYSQARVRVVASVALLTLLPVLVTGLALLKLYRGYSLTVEKRLDRERWSGPSRLYSRPFTLRRGRSLSPAALVDRLNSLSYSERSGGDPVAGEFVRGDDLVTFHPRPAAGATSERMMVFFDRERVLDIHGLESQRKYDEVSLEPELITYLLDGPRSKQRDVAYEEVPSHLVQCVLAAEDRRFFEHPGVDLFRTAAAAVRNIEAESYIQGGSTITQQLVKNFFLTPEKTIRRKAQEALLAFVVERHASKREILELYLNEVYLGQAGSFAVHGVGQAARLYFQKDVVNVSLAESALLAGMIQSPNRYNPYRHADDARARRNVVLHATQIARFLPEADVQAAAQEPVRVTRATVDVSEAPFFVDAVKEQLSRELGSRPLTEGLDVHTTLDPYLQSVARQVLTEGLLRIDNMPKRRARAKAGDAPLQAALIALEPSTGAIVALVGGRSYAASQFNRATQAQRQPGSTFKPFVYLAAFEATFDQPELPPLTPATLVEDAPATFFYEHDTYAPNNNGQRYLGFVTLRRALAMSLNVATLKVADVVGYPRIADVVTRVVGREFKPYPSLALGAVEVTPLELASAFSVLASGGIRVSPAAITAIRDHEGHDLTPRRAEGQRVVRPESAFLVTNMLRSVINEGTANGVRRLGFKDDAAGKTGTTDDTRDAWFVGYTPDLLCVVWVGYDDNAPLKLMGSEAALPIWTEFMKRATAGTKPKTFSAPTGVVYADVDRETGLLANGHCPRIFKEAFIAGAVPVDNCLWHAQS